MWSNINRRVDEELDTVDAVEGGPDENPEVQDEPAGTSKDSTFERSAVKGIIQSMWEKVTNINVELQSIIQVLEKEIDDENLSKVINAKLGARSALKALQEKAADKKLYSGEWIDIALQKINMYTQNTKIGAFNALLKVLLYDIVPYDFCNPQPTRVEGIPYAGKFPENVPTQKVPLRDVAEDEVKRDDIEEKDSVPVKGKKSSLSVGKYKVKSVIGEDGKRKWPCPYPGCSEVFGSSGKCGGHLNEHLGRAYECPKCKYMSYSLDAYEKHKCFKGYKTQGEVVRQKRKAEETEKPKAKKAKIEAEVHAADKIKVEKDAQGEEIEKPKEESAHKGCCSAGKPKAKDKPKAVVKPKVKEAKDTVKIEKEGDVEIIVLD